MKKKIAIMISIILMAGTFTACMAEEKVNNDIKTSVVSKAADVSVSTETSATAATEKTTETTNTEKATVSKETEPLGQNIKTEENPTQPPTKTKIPLHLIIIIFRFAIDKDGLI